MNADHGPRLFSFPFSVVTPLSKVEEQDQRSTYLLVQVQGNVVWFRREKVDIGATSFRRPAGQHKTERDAVNKTHVILNGLLIAERLSHADPF